MCHSLSLSFVQFSSSKSLGVLLSQLCRHGQGWYLRGILCMAIPTECCQHLWLNVLSATFGHILVYGRWLGKEWTPYQLERLKLFFIMDSYFVRVVILVSIKVLDQEGRKEFPQIFRIVKKRMIPSISIFYCGQKIRWSLLCFFRIFFDQCVHFIYLM